MTTDRQNEGSRHWRVLVVEDDFTSREILRIGLEKCGLVVVLANGVPAAQAELQALGFAAFDCVVTDYQMGVLTGLDLLAWLKMEGSHLATIMLTGLGEKTLVADSLRGGAVDFLDKPVDIPKLFAAITKAVAFTEQARHAAEMSSAVQELGRTQAWLLQSQPAGLPVRLDICFHPKLEAGGDFFTHFKPGPDQYCCLLTDVSGHDLQAAYVSAYFQGVVRGMLRCANSLPEVFTYFNHLLLEEWNHLTSGEPGTSVAVCALWLDFQLQTAQVITCGAPAPAFVTAEGRVQILAEPGGVPLGWFEDFAVPVGKHFTAPGGVFLLWTDGLEDYAEKLGVSPLSAGFALLEARAQRRLPLDLATARDDILFAEVRQLLPEPVGWRWQPLVFERYHGGQLAEIDALAASWTRSLQLAVPALGGALLYDLMLASREAVLNALQHGCGHDTARWATFQISYEPAGRRFCVWVDDPGPGHDFSPAAGAATTDRLESGHRGLLLMRQLSRRLTVERHGAGVRMELGPEPISLAECLQTTTFTN